MKKLLHRIFTLLLLIIFVTSVSGCQYDIPDEASKTPHTYTEVVAYIEEYLGASDVVVSEIYVDNETEYGRKYRVWEASYNNVNFVISSQQESYWDSTGEFAKYRYTLRNNYDSILLIHILESLQSEYANYVIRIEEDDYLSFYDYTFIDYSIIIDTEEELLTVFNQSSELYQEISRIYPEVKFVVKVQVNEDESKSVYISSFEEYDILPFSQEAYQYILDRFISLNGD